jgi:hypothetical protein
MGIEWKKPAISVAIRRDFFVPCLAHWNGGKKIKIKKLFSHDICPLSNIFEDKIKIKIYSGIKFCHVLPALEHHTYSEDNVEEGGIKIKKTN